MSRLRAVIGATLRRRRQSQARTLREVADAAGVSLTYLSEVERGRKEASSEVLEAICAALGLVLSDLLFEVAEALVRLEVRGALPRIGFIPPSGDPLDGRLPDPTTPERRPASARVPAMLAPLGDDAVTRSLSGPPVVDTPSRARVAPVIDLRAYAGRRSA